ncbi:MAG: histone deacetylase [Desulfobulbaceae bacterium]|nr:histone deacetylase [Desulfobulbaceae bacterium]
MPPDTITVISDPYLLLHDTGGEEHPETPERLKVIEKKLHSGPLGHSLEIIGTRPAAREHLLAFHTEAWLFRFEESALSGRTYIDHPDNQVCYESYGVAQSSAGTGITGVDFIEKKGGGTVFCATRPPGHHAEPNMPFGFCFFNNCVIAARYWQKKYGRKRICILDFDAHHGNGIQTAFEEEADSLYISIHEHPSFSYPGTGYAEERGMGKGIGTILNIPLSPGSGDRKVLAALDGQIEQKLAEFRPEALIVAAGFDGHRLDDMSGLNYSTDLYGMLGERIRGWADSLAGGRVVSLLEGGYHLESLAAGVEAYLSGLHKKNE